MTLAIHMPLNTLAGNVGNMSPTRRNVANFCPDRPILATWFLVCRLTFVSLFPDIDGPRTDQICMCVDKHIHTVFPCGPPFHTTTQGPCRCIFIFHDSTTTHKELYVLLSLQAKKRSKEHQDLCCDCIP